MIKYLFGDKPYMKLIMKRYNTLQWEDYNLIKYNFK